ncbi:alkaline phosphatase [Nesterenkonia sp. PF2B19]|uniref:alkaline phosphatase n=1 Tax=Nesterenkonia sp. PF2B19 TaxID=1881858 RepID=UPI000A19B84F|nr:alkaline phosphatase [Nesterenkonia sp. PF2B19]OSM42660.1 alkaline phosphatase [Nesterenkonia sp. PF2B19]
MSPAPSHLSRGVSLAAAVALGAAALGASAPALAGVGAPAPASADAEQGPKNVIYMIGDGMGYNHLAATNLYETGQTRYQVEGDADPETLEELPGEAVQTYEDWDMLALSTYAAGGEYDPQAAWSDHDWVQTGATDSAAAGTAMATGEKTTNGTIGLDADGEVIENLSERAIATGRSAGVVSSVPFSHATPAAWAAHNESRNNYHEIADEMIDSDLDVIFGAGHPHYDDDSKKLKDPEFTYIAEEDFERLAGGETEFEFTDKDSDFAKYARGKAQHLPERAFGLAQVASTLQHGRSGDSQEPYDVKQNTVVDLPTMSEAALNILSQNDEGFHLMVEGGAIDWAGHANDTARDIEEVQDFNDAVDAVVEWVETESSWEETLVIVTADHETGYLAGPDDQPGFTPMTGEAGQLPDLGWYSGDHTNQVVPFFVRGAGSEAFFEEIVGTDPVRGDYVDNTVVADVLMDGFWAVED